ncbi:LytR/AlgR family response regulator transcription factor [Sphingomonas sp. Leaf20]|uniref:LytR/AlgR family response regulator transcription factor n=1 Tax=Sphingomonas sp. Leaf20 TaxID=1735685 RepID=UPI0006FF205D|nr:response regulator [Sphingomonas sp. Leaf20]KQM72277.1 LytTR family transcriptional regulator [Sphingomonas sp. Leaf20]
MIRTLIIDDEPLARRAVRQSLAGFGDFEMVGEAGHGAEAVAAISTLRPDLVFLDVQMPEMDGFGVIEAIGVDAMPLVVFVTAFDAYAVRAFEAEALDYLLKPFDDQRFARVIERVRRQFGMGGGQRDGMRSLLGGQGRLVARGNGLAQLVRLDEIDWISAAGDYAEVHAGGRSLLIHESLTSLEARLPQAAFARIHRAAIVRLDRLVEVRSGTHGDGVARLACGAELRFSRRYREPIDVYLTR